MIRDTYQNILDKIEVRQNLSKLRQELKEDSNRSAFLYLIAGDYAPLIELLDSEDAKTRKNVVLVLGQIGDKSLVAPIYEAYEKEAQMFVKSAYLIALKEFDYRAYLPKLKERLEELRKKEVAENEKKHVSEEIRALTDLVVMVEGTKSHKFTGYSVPSRIVLLTNRNHIQVVRDELKSERTKEFGAGLIVDTCNLKEIVELRTYSELLFMVEGMVNASGDVSEMAKTVASSNLLEFLEKRHRGKAPFYFRIELKSRMELDKKSVLLKKLSSEIERLTDGKLINSTSNYEIELRFIEKKEGGYYILLKLYTLVDERFAYRKESIATSIRPVNAALMMALTKEYQKEEAKILDPFCGVATMLIERHKSKAANTMYGIDTFGEAIEKAKINADEAHQFIHFIHRDFFDFKHEYLFDEIVTNMPHVTGRKDEKEIYEIYRKFFGKSKEHLESDGTILMYSHNRDFVRTLAPKMGYVIVKEYEISMKEGTYVYVLRIK